MALPSQKKSNGAVPTILFFHDYFRQEPISCFSRIERGFAPKHFCIINFKTDIMKRAIYYVSCLAGIVLFNLLSACTSDKDQTVSTPTVTTAQPVKVNDSTY